MNWDNTKYLIKCDLHRYPYRGMKKFAVEGARFMVIFRLVQYTNNKKILKPIDIALKLVLLHLEHKFGIQIPVSVQIGKGFYIGHYGNIVVNGKVKIGENVNISHEVTLGVSNRGLLKGTPVIGNEVFIGPGAKILGNICIGNNVAIGANAVVTKDVPNNTCVAGAPAKIINNIGAEGYINRKA